MSKVTPTRIQGVFRDATNGRCIAGVGPNISSAISVVIIVRRTEQ